MHRFNECSVHKFGGSSLASHQQFKNIVEILNEKDAIIVVSAIAGTTDQLQQLLDLAESGESFQSVLDSVYNQHIQLVQKLLIDDQQQAVTAHIDKDMLSLKDVLQAIALVHASAPEMQATVLGFGEQWSAMILASCLAQTCNSLYLNARDVLFINQSQGVTQVDWPASLAALTAYVADKEFDKLVITGFIASDQAHKPVTLGRNGSDFSAAIFAKLFDVKQLTIWSDVDGIYSADPRRVLLAFVLSHLSYKEALELAYFGASVLHPNALWPAIENNTVIRIKNSFNPSANGTMVSADKAESAHLVKGIATIDAVALINIEGTGMMGVSGVAARAFESLHQEDISVILISQASSEHSICFAIKVSQCEQAIQVLTKQFKLELDAYMIDAITADRSCAILAVVGDGMVGSPGVAGKLCDTLAQANINIRAISQGSSERNISLILSNQDITKALRAVHAGFYLSNKTLSIGLIGPGLVGSALLTQINEAIARLKTNDNIQLLVRGIMNSKKMLLAERNIDLANWQQALSDSVEVADIDAFANHLLSDNFPHTVIIDCTANQSIADQYHDLIVKGLHIITPNKRANSGDLAYYHQLKSACIQYNRHYLYETTVCAGLPVIETLRELLRTGDKILEVSGIVSGTLGYIFNEFAQGMPFSEIITQAKQAGYTEPDPRDDLSGMDVARKMICLAREMGYPALLQDVDVHNLVPAPLREVDCQQFMDKLSEYDSEISANLSAKLQAGERAFYVGTITADGAISVEIKGVSMDHPLAKLSGADNMLVFKSQRYFKQPLVIQGPGAGADVTAAGVFADLLRLANYISS